MGSKEILGTLKKVVHQPYNGLTQDLLADVADFTFVTRKISCLLCKFISPEVSVINLFANLQVFLERLANSSKFLGFFLQSELRHLKINKNLPELDRRGKISSVLKLAVDSVNLGLCDSCNYFASPLVIVKKMIF